MDLRKTANRSGHFWVITGYGPLNNHRMSWSRSWVDCNSATYTCSFPLLETERRRDGDGAGVSVCFGPLVVNRWDGKWDVLDGPVLTLAQTTAHRYRMFDDAGSKRRRDNGKESLALSLWFSVCLCVCIFVGVYVQIWCAWVFMVSFKIM